MVRGCQKKIVYLKSTGSEVFDEAYFVVRDGALANKGECDMIEEANKILNECMAIDEKCGFLSTVKEAVKEKVIPFMIGMTLGILITILIK